MDICDKEKRSRIMKSVRQQNTTPEILVRKYLYSQGYRYRINVKKLPGSPDIVLSKYKTAIYVHGCFWHGHSCKKGKRPSTNTDYWYPKIESNISRDQRNEKQMREDGWEVIVIWECELCPSVREQTIKKLISSFH